MPALQLYLEPVAAAAGTARHATAEWLRANGAGGAGADDALVVVTELVTNGVVHDGGDDIKLRVEEADRCLTIDVVTTPRPEGLPPFPRPTADPNETGRGMTVVAALCSPSVP